MGNFCLRYGNFKELTLEDQINYLDQEDAYLRQTIEHQKKKIQSKMDNNLNSETIELMSRQLKMLSGVSELSTYIKTSIDMRDDNSKAAVEKDFLISLPPLISLYKDIKDQGFKDKRYVDDFFSKVKIYIHIQKDVNL